MKDNILKALHIINDNADFEKSSDFMEDGLIDSFEVVSLVSELEGIFQIEIRGIDILPENFKNLDAIAALIEKYLEGK